MIKKALEELKELINYLIDFEENYSEYELETIESLLKTKQLPCVCDSYNGYNCGCASRNGIFEIAIKEVETLKTNKNISDKAEKHKFKKGNFINKSYVKCPHIDKECKWKLSGKTGNGACYLSGSFDLDCPE